MDASSFRSFVDVFDHWAQVRPDGCAVCCQGTELSWAQLRELSLSVAGHVQAEAGVEVVAVLSRRSPTWLAATLGIMRCGLPFVWMGGGEVKGRQKERQRNEEIMRLLQPQLVLLGSAEKQVMPSAVEMCRCLRLEEILSKPTAAVEAPVAPAAPALLSFQLTGGTTGSSKCVQVTHAMALHEVKAYRQAFPEIGAEDRVLQHTAVLWAASAIGQINIAVSFGATICISEALDQESMRGCSVLGCVPSSLEALEPTRSLRFVFVWGEAMAPRLAAKWRASCRVVELLISTEYWLSLYSEEHSSAGRSIFRRVAGAEVAVLRDGQLHNDGTGELCLRGPMVTTGYRGTWTSFVEAQGGHFFKTSDLVTLLDANSLEFRGRSDMLVKVGGQFVDLLEAERRLQEALPSMGAEEVSVLPGSAGGAAAHVFVSVAGPWQRASAARLLSHARAALPRAAALHVLGRPLPKDEVSGKVDRRKLLEGISVTPETNMEMWPVLRARLLAQVPWLLGVALFGGLNVSSWLIRERMFRPSWKNLLQLLLHLAAVPYLWLFSLHIPVQACRYFINYVPLGRIGLLSILYHLARSKGGKAVASRAALISAALFGASRLRRNELMSWWLVFWLAIPETAKAECGWWLSAEGWRWYFDEVLSFALDFRRRSCSSMERLVDGLRWSWQCLQQSRLEALAPYVPPKELRPRERREAPATGPAEEAADVAVQEPETYRRPPSEPEEPQKQREEEPEEMLEDPPEELPEEQPEEQPTEEETKEEQQTASSSDRALARQVEELIAAVQQADQSSGLDSERTAALCAVLEASDRKQPFGEALSKLLSSHGWTGTQFRGPPDLKQLMSNLLDIENKAPRDPPPELAPEAEKPEWTCAECSKPLPWGSSWQQEMENFYCSSCYRSFDERWWDFHTCDIVDCVDEADEPDAPDAPDAPAAHAEALTASTVQGARLLELLANELGQDFCAETHLAGIDSLRVLTLCRQLRVAVPGLSLRPQEVFECTSVGELLTLVEAQCLEAAEAAEAAEEAEAEASGGAARCVWFAPGQVNNTCKWLYGCHGLLEEQCFRRAAARLLVRHEGLRGTMEGGGMEVLRFLRDVGPFHCVLWRQLEHFQRCKDWVAWSLKKSWPKSVPMRITREFLDERIKVVKCRSWRDVERASQHLRDDVWEPPIAIGLFLLTGEPGDPAAERPEDWGAPSSFIQFVVSHAYSDGFCSVPMVQDLAALYAEEEDALLGRASTRRLLPLRPGAAFAELEARLFAAFEAKPSWSHPEQMSLRAAIFDTAPKWPCWVYCHKVLVESNAVTLLRRCATMYRLPFDVVLLAMVLAASFRATWQRDRTKHFYNGQSDEDFEQKTTKMSMALTFYAPMRDGDLNDAMVGLFSDWRDLTVPCSSSASLLGFCLDLAELIRHRRWTVFDPLKNQDNILVNILPLDEQARGEQQFMQTRAHEYGRGRSSPQERRRAYKAPHGHRPMRITLEQEAPDAWWIALDINESCYKTAWCRAFAKSLAQSVKDLQRRPMLPVLRADWSSQSPGTPGTP